MRFVLPLFFLVTMTPGFVDVNAAERGAPCNLGKPSIEVRRTADGIVVQLSLPATQVYGPWIDGPDYKYREYMVTVGCTTKRHYVIWFPSDKNHCYCYNRGSRVYWGRWSYAPDRIVFSHAVKKKSTLANVVFLPPAQEPIAPGTQLEMTPPALPEDLPLDLPRH